MFANPPLPLGKVNFKIKISLLQLNETSRSAQKGHFINPDLHVGVGGVEGITLQKTKTITRN